MDEPTKKNFVRQMRDALQKQLSEFETRKKKEQLVADNGARRWRELKDSLRRLVEEITDGFSEGLLTCPVSANDDEFTLMHELSGRTMQVTFDPASGVITYQGNSGKGEFRPRVEGDTLEYGWEYWWETTTLPLFTSTKRAIALEDDKPPKPPMAYSTERMSEIIIQCIVEEPVREG